MNNSDKTILDLCGGTGSWSQQYKGARYDVKVITLPEYSVCNYVIRDGYIIFFHYKYSDSAISIKLSDIYGILIAAPCTMFSFARTNAKTPRDFDGAMKIVLSCLEIVWECQKQIVSQSQKCPPLKFWAFENPNGMLNWFLGKPVFEFNPFDFGDAYKKHTCLWGHFNEPKKKTIKINHKLPKFDHMKNKDIHPEFLGKYNRTVRRSITPPGFAKAFFKANQ